MARARLVSTGSVHSAPARARSQRATEGQGGVGVANSREGVGYCYLSAGAVPVPGRAGVAALGENVGAVVVPAGVGAAAAYENVGGAPASAGEAHALCYEGEVCDATPTPHLWFARPAFGRAGWEFEVVGQGLGASPAEYAGRILLAGRECGVLEWRRVGAGADAYGPERAVDPAVDAANVERVLVRLSVPAGAPSGVVVCETNGP